MEMRSAIVSTALVLGLAGCSDDSPTPVATDPGVDWQVVYVSGNWQAVTPGQPLPEPFIVQVQDGAGHPVAGASVAWRRIVSNTLSVLEAVSVSDAQGLARLHFTPSAVRVRIRAELEGYAWRNPVLFDMVPHPYGVYERLSPTSYCAELVCEYLVFYGDQTFDLRDSRGFGFTGTYSRNGQAIHLQFAADVRWQATAAIGGDSLLVSYTFEADMSGFESGVFLRTQGVVPWP